MNHIGPLFTWTNKRTTGFLANNLDRFLVNSSLLQLFSDFVVNLWPLISPITVLEGYS